jgi:hypothetical protein
MGDTLDINLSLNTKTEFIDFLKNIQRKYPTKIVCYNTNFDFYIFDMKDDFKNFFKDKIYLIRDDLVINGQYGYISIEFVNKNIEVEIKSMYTFA